MSLFITDAELYDLLRLDKVNGPAVVRALEKSNVTRPFPKPRAPFDLRFTAEVVQWLQDFHKIRTADGQIPVIDGKENFNAPRKARRTQSPRTALEPKQRPLGSVLGGPSGLGEARLHAQDPKIVAFERSPGTDRADHR